MSRFIHLSGVCASAFLVACADPSVSLPEGGPYVRGPVESITHRATASGIMVSAGPGSREACGIAATADESTRYLRRSAGGMIAEVDLSELQVGDTVEVYVDGPIAESCPVQGHAVALVIVGESERE